MALIRKRDLRNMQTEELKSRLKDLKTELIKNNAQRATRQNAGKVRIIRRTIAKILTALNTKKTNTKQ